MPQKDTAEKWFKLKNCESLCIEHTYILHSFLGCNVHWNLLILLLCLQVVYFPLCIFNSVQKPAADERVRNGLNIVGISEVTDSNVQITSSASLALTFLGSLFNAFWWSSSSIGEPVWLRVWFWGGLQSKCLPPLEGRDAARAVLQSSPVGLLAAQKLSVHPEDS